MAPGALAVLLEFRDVLVALVIEGLDRGGADERAARGNESAILGIEPADILAATNVQLLNVIIEHLLELVGEEHLLDSELAHILSCF